MLLIYPIRIVSGLETGSQVKWLQLGKLLEEGQYARLAEHLLDLQTSIEEADHPDLKNLSIAALQICVLCQQCQLEIEWHRRANQEVQKRAHELKGQLRSLLKLIIEYESLKNDRFPPISVTVSALTDGETPEVSEHPTIWQRIQQLFNYEPEPPTPTLQQSSVVIDALFTELAENVERLAKLDDGIEGEPPSDEEPDPVTASKDEEIGISTSLPENAEIVEESTAPVKFKPGLERQDIAIDSIEKTTPDRETQPSLMVYCLGPFRVYQNDQLITEWQSSKGKAIFKYIVTHRARPVGKEVLMELFWPGADPDTARNNLNVAIYGLRQALRQEQSSYSHLLFKDDCYLLNPELRVWNDCEAFSQHLSTGEYLDRQGKFKEALQEYLVAEALYQGEFLEEDRYEEWLLSQRQYLSEEYLNLLNHLSRYYFDQGEDNACATMCRKMLAIDPCREETHRRLMRCYQRQGQTYLALRQYHLCFEALKNELDIAPATATRDLYELIRKHNQG